MLLILAVLSQPITYCVPFAEYSLCGETTHAYPVDTQSCGDLLDVDA